MITKVPFQLFPKRVAQPISKGFYPVVGFLRPAFKGLEQDLEEAESTLDIREYVSGALLAASTLFVIVILASIYLIASGMAPVPDVKSRSLLLMQAALLSFAVFFYAMNFPKWVAGKKRLEMEKDLLFAVRHLMIQTSAGIPLFEGVVSLTETYGEGGEEKSEYGEVGREFTRIVLEVRSGKELTAALEESADRSSSKNFRKVLWQLANANKTGAKIGPVLKDEVEYLANEQMIMIRSYGSQLGTLALFYMLACIIAPTMGVVMLAIGASVLPTLPLNESTFVMILIALVVAQVVFVGVIKSRRPAVSL